MTTRKAIYARTPQAVRVLLVFLLVFGTTLQAEWAIADGPGLGESSLVDHRGDTLTNLTVYELDSPNTVGKRVRSIFAMAKGDDDDICGRITVDYGETVEFAAVPEWNGDEESAAAEFATWSVDGASDGVCVDDRGALLALENTYGGDEPEVTVVEITCEVSKRSLQENSVELSESLENASGEGDELKIGFQYELTLNPKEKEAEGGSSSSNSVERSVGSLACRFTGDVGDDGLSLTAEQGANGYQLPVEVSYTIVSVKAEDGGEETESTEGFTYVSSQGRSLSEYSDGLLEDVQWEAREVSGGAVSLEDGFLRMEAGSSCTAVCSTAATEGQPQARCQVEVTCDRPSSDDPDDPPEKEIEQGADHRQDMLAISGYLSASAFEDSEGYEDEEEEQYEDASGHAYKYVGIAFTADEFTDYFAEEGLCFESEERHMYSAEYGPVLVRGTGVMLQDLLSEMFVEDFSVIDELQFIDYKGNSTTLSWKSISSGKHDPLVAISSCVYEEEDADPPDELDRTRFRILFEDDAMTSPSAIVDADALRYICEIVINPNVKVTEVDKSDEKSEKENEGEKRPADDAKGSGGTEQGGGDHPHSDADADAETDADTEVDADADFAPALTPIEAPVAASPENRLPDDASADAPHIYIDESVSQQVRAQESVTVELLEKAAPGVKRVDLSRYGYRGEDRDFLAGNPFVPFAIALCLGMMAAGCVERVIEFRRQLRADKAS